MVAGLVAEETGLPPQVQVTDSLNRVPILDVGGSFPATAVPAAAVGQRPDHFKAVAVAVALVGRESHPSAWIDVDGNAAMVVPDVRSATCSLTLRRRRLPWKVADASQPG